MDHYLNDLLTRLQLCHTELVSTGTYDLKKAFKLLPIGEVNWQSYPFCMVAAGDAAFTYPDPSIVEIRRNLDVTIVVSPSSVDLPDSNGNSQAMQAAVDLERTFVQYYLLHPGLHTASLAKLGFLEVCLPVLSRPVVLNVPSARPDGPKVEYTGVQITLRTLIKHWDANSPRSYGGF